MAAAGTGEQTLTAALDNPDGDVLNRRQAARAEAEEEQRRAAEREARQPVCLRRGGEVHRPALGGDQFGTLVPTRDHTIAEHSKNYQYSTNHQVIIDATLDSSW